MAQQDPRHPPCRVSEYQSDEHSEFFITVKMGKMEVVGNLVQTENGAIWTIPKNEVMKIKKNEERTSFLSDKAFFTDSGFVFGLALTTLEEGEVGVMGLVNDSKVPVKLEGTVILQQEREWDVKVSGLPDLKAAGIKVPHLFAVTTRALVVEVRVSSCEMDTTAGPVDVATVEVAKGVVGATKGEVAAEVEEPWSLEKALANLGEETTKEKIKKTNKITKKEKRKQKLQENIINKKDDKSTEDEESNYQEDITKEKEQRTEMVENIERLKIKLMMDEEELKGLNIEVSRTTGEVEELVEEQRRSRRREEQLEGHLAEEVRSRERDLMKLVAEEEGRERQLEEELRQVASVAQASPRLLEAATRPGTGHTKEEQDARVAPSLKNLGAIPKTRAATTRQASSKMPGASSPPPSKAQRSVERMVRLLEGRGRLASLPSPSLHHLVAQLRARLGGLSDLSLSYVEQEVARMAVEEAE